MSAIAPKGQFTAGNAFIVIYLCSAVFIAADSVHTAGSCAGALYFKDSVIGAYVLAAAALDTFFVIYLRLSVADRNSPLGTNLLAGVFKAALTNVRYVVMEGRAGVAGKADYIYKRGIIIFFRNGAFVNALGYGSMLADTSQRQTHSQSKTFLDDRSFKKNGFTVSRHITGADLIGQIFHA